MVDAGLILDLAAGRKPGQQATTYVSRRRRSARKLRKPPTLHQIAN
jgi:hypothetical protein